MTIFSESRIGKIKISRDLLESSAGSDLGCVFGEIITVKVSRDENDPRVYVYVAYSKHFRQVEEGGIIPTYRIECTEGNAEFPNFSVKFVEQK